MYVLSAVLFRFISFVALGRFELVLDGCGSFHIVVTTRSQDKRSIVSREVANYGLDSVGDSRNPLCW